MLVLVAWFLLIHTINTQWFPYMLVLVAWFLLMSIL